MLPFITALIIDEGIQEGNMRKVYTYGGIMIVMALISLISGAMAGKYAASASSGLACNLRKGIYDKVQHGRSGDPYDHGCNQYPERLSNVYPGGCQGAPYAGMQHGHVFHD